MFRVEGPVHDVGLAYDDRILLRSRTNLSLSPATISSYTYGVIDIGQRVSLATGGSAYTTAYSVATNRPALRDYGYDDGGQVISSSVVDSGTTPAALTSHLRGYHYDGLGNREASIEGSTNPAGMGAVIYDPNELNQYEDIDSLAPLHDLDGSLTSGTLPVAPSQLHTLVWDGENRLVRVVVTGGATTAYTYDAYGRRMSVQRHQFLMQGEVQAVRRLSR